MLALSKAPVKGFMNPHVVNLQKGVALFSAAQVMLQMRVGAVVIMDGTLPIGMITARDFVKLYQSGVSHKDQLTVEDAMSKPLITVTPSTSFARAFSLLNKFSVKNLPVVHKGQLKGMVTFQNLLNYSHENLINILEKNRTLQKEANTDGLTGLFNKRYFLRRITEEYERSKRYSLRCSLIFIDIDHFKRINDGYSHQAGDYVLRIISKILQTTARRTDVLSRFGGEEFVIITPNSNPVEAAYLAHKMRVAVRDTAFSYNDDSFKITISAGVATFSSHRTVKQIIERADTALYRAKKMGRNRVCRWSESINKIVEVPYQEM